MRNTKRTARNSLFSFINQLFTLGLALLLRRLTIRFIGVEVLGISSAFASLLETLSLAELGFNTSVTFFLYKPLHEKQFDEVSSILGVFRFVYKCVALFVAISALLISPFIGKILKGTVIDTAVYIYFVLTVLDTIASYLLSYKRILLYADQKDYYSQMIDFFFNLIFGTARIGIIILFHRYDLFLVSKVLQTILSNTFIYKKCNSLYPSISKKKLDTNLLKKIFEKVKHVFGSRLAYYINTSTDGIVISSIIGTITVGIFTNYTTITIGIKRLVVSIMKPVSPLLGDMIADKTVDDFKLEKTLRAYTHIIYVISVFTLIPTLVLLNPFIQFIYGEKYLLDANISRLLVLDLYITFIHRGCCDIINGQGLFTKDKYIEYFAAVLNIALSIFLAYRIGVIGVLLGTVISDFFTWVGRSYVVYKYSLHDLKGCERRFASENIKYFIFFIVMYVVCLFMVNRIPKHIPFVIWFALSGIICELLLVIVYITVFSRSEEYQLIKQEFLSAFVKRKGRNDK